MDLFLNERVLCINHKYIVSYKSGYIYIRNSQKKDIIISRIKLTKKLLTKIPIVTRLMRLEPRCGFFLSDNVVLISFNGSLYRYEIDKNLFVAEHHYQSEVNNPLNFCVIKENHIVLKVLYGEYFWNEKKGPVSIFCRENNKWTKVYTFPEKSITHIHNIIFDDIRNVYFILTGDLNEESGVWVADLNFERVKPLLLGQQRFRSCVAFPTRKGLLYATDTPLEKNYIYEVCIDSNMNVSEINSISELQGPCIYGTNYNNKFYFSTSVEPDSTLSKWNYRFTNKLGKGVLSRYSYIVEVDHNCDVKTICSLKKDGFPMWLFQFGNIHFPENEMFPLMFTSQALRGGHNKTYILGGKNEE